MKKSACILGVWLLSGQHEFGSSRAIKIPAMFFQVPVGRETLGRIINVLGEPVDEVGPIGKHS